MRSELDTLEHVLRGALNTISLNLQVLAAGVERDGQARTLLDRSSSELRRLSSDLLPALFRTLALEIREVRPVDVREIVERTLAERGLRAPVRSTKVPTIAGDPALLAAAVAHLVDNAVAATPAGAEPPHIALEAGPEGGVTVVVANACAEPAPPLTADGIPAARGRVGGVVATMRIARLHGGALTYERRDRELMARLSLPAGPPAAPATAQGGRPPGASPPPSGPSRERGTHR